MPVTGYYLEAGENQIEQNGDSLCDFVENILRHLNAIVESKTATKGIHRC